MKIKAVIDRFEGERAILLTGEEEIAMSWLRSWLPEDIREGDILHITAEHDKAATQQAKADAEALLKELLDGQPGPKQP